jgi:hypothetical protein
MSTHTHRIPQSKRVKTTEEIVSILRTVPYEKGFHFYTASGSFTGETATSLHTFEKKLQIVPSESVSFHIQRGDFQKWIDDTLGDKELAKRINLTKPTLPPQDLRKVLLAIVQTRISELKRELPHHLQHNHS